jgi:hypothetical protein
VAGAVAGDEALQLGEPLGLLSRQSR